jgi:hypothetical protein
MERCTDFSRSRTPQALHAYVELAEELGKYGWKRSLRTLGMIQLFVFAPLLSLQTFPLKQCGMAALFDARMIETRTSNNRATIL